MQHSSVSLSEQKHWAMEWNKTTINPHWIVVLVDQIKAYYEENKIRTSLDVGWINEIKMHFGAKYSRPRSCFVRETKIAESQIFGVEGRKWLQFLYRTLPKLSIYCVGFFMQPEHRNQRINFNNACNANKNIHLRHFGFFVFFMSRPALVVWEVNFTVSNERHPE